MVEMIIAWSHVKAPIRGDYPKQTLEKSRPDQRLARAQRDFTRPGSTSLLRSVNSRRWITRAKPQTPI